MNKKILIVDDDSNLRLLYQKELRNEGYLVTTVESGDKAIELLSLDSFQLIILDIEMPELSGLELITHLKKIAPQTFIIINSAYTTYKADFNSWLADAYLVKSSDLQPLKNEIKKLLKEVNV